MTLEMLLDKAMAESLMEQRREERRKLLREDPHSQIEVSLPELARLLHTSGPLLVRSLDGKTLEEGMSHKGRIVVRGELFTTLEQTLREIRAEKRWIRH